MRGYTLKNKEKQLYLKSIDTKNETIEFTSNVNEAKVYDGGEWFANTELEYIQFHFPQEEEILNGMVPYYEEW